MNRRWRRRPKPRHRVFLSSNVKGRATNRRAALCFPKRRRLSSPYVSISEMDVPSEAGPAIQKCRAAETSSPAPFLFLCHPERGCRAEGPTGSDSLSQIHRDGRLSSPAPCPFSRRTKAQNRFAATLPNAQGDRSDTPRGRNDEDSRLTGSRMRYNVHQVTGAGSERLESSKINVHFLRWFLYEATPSVRRRAISMRTCRR